MREVFDDQEQEPVPLQQDTELTLSSGVLLAMGLGLVVLCGLCFGLGYMVGHHRSPVSPAAASQTAEGIAAVAASSIAKPAAMQGEPTSPAQSADSSQDPAEPSASAPGEATPVSAQSERANVAPDPPLIRPALTPAVATTTTQAGQSGSAPATLNAVRPAFAPVAQPVAAPAPGGSLMVQIAAVSNAQDAEVLSNALRKRGYAVTNRREPADNLIHVRIGPFATLSEANTWKMKLLNDGYNAIVQP